MNVLIFGTGKFYQNRKEHIREVLGEDEVLGFLDNHRTGIFEGKPVYAPEDGIRLPYDKILLMSAAASEMREQLLSLGISDDQIVLIDELSAWKASGKLQIYAGSRARTGKRILIISEMLDYNGGAMAAVYAAEALQGRGYDVSLAVPNVNENLLHEVQAQGLTVIYCPTLPFVFEAERRWISTFDIVLVNVFPMMVSAIEISQFRPVLWWIHEPSGFYPWTLGRFVKHASRIPQFHGRILAVSSIAEQNFHSVGMPDGRMPYGIPDTGRQDESSENVHHGICFALIGSIGERKAPDVFLEALSHLQERNEAPVSALIIGPLGESDYVRRLQETATGLGNVCFTGNLTRAEMKKMFCQIDVVVCPSREDPLPIVVTEGMMHRKICIASDATGQAQDIIRDGENGFICKAGDAASLTEKMSYVIEHFDELNPMREKARETYEKYFSMEAFGERLERELLLTEKEYWEREKKG